VAKLLSTLLLCHAASPNGLSDTTLPQCSCNRMS
jgi:hypothetical protein